MRKQCLPGRLSQRPGIEARPHQIDLMFQGFLISKNRPGWQTKKRKKLMNIIIKPQTESQHTTKSHFSKTLQHFARSRGYSDL